MVIKLDVVAGGQCCCGCADARVRGCELSSAWASCSALPAGKAPALWPRRAGRGVLFFVVFSILVLLSLSRWQ